MTIASLNLSAAHPSWHTCLQQALRRLNPSYLKILLQSHTWLPGPDKIFNAFSLPLPHVKYVLFGESPYPRQASANGFAFWDAAVTELWSPKGLSKQVNRATSLRNMLKMLLIAEGALTPDNCSQAAIARLDKRSFVDTGNALFNNFIQRGFLLLNATPVLNVNTPHKDARAWRPFTQLILNHLLNEQPNVSLILLGRIAREIDPLISCTSKQKLYAEHPYNLSFISNPVIRHFFSTLHLLKRPH
ncbi:MAG: hypothetical protein A3E85_05120 [Gammaproteobacteria bacterium RIFCSPHIGHO2_12_FULL_45_12]|nr:MAG: hypothetical protein A3E85_05120 [Gammaproteobacteria bacterium RIFCSPHIGHO2_12_FULL_45_12]